MSNLFFNPAKLFVIVLGVSATVACGFIVLFVFLVTTTIPQLPYGQDIAWDWVFGRLNAGPCTPVDLPVAGEITADFSDPDYLARFGTEHAGVDIAVPQNTPAVATIEGEVKFAGWNDEGYGNLIILQNGDYTTYYGHLEKIQVKEGERISKGQIIGLTGNTGNSTGPHIHYEVRYMGEPMNIMVGNGDEVYISGDGTCDPKLPPPPFITAGDTLQVVGSGAYRVTHAELLPEDRAPGWHGRVFGFVRNVYGAGKAGTEVEVAWDGGHMLTRTGDNGWYEFILGPGQYRVQVVDDSSQAVYFDTVDCYMPGHCVNQVDFQKGN